MKLIYVCSPYRAYGGTAVADNLRRVNRYSRSAALSGYIPIAPHAIFTQFLDDGIAEEREAGLYMGKHLLRFCDEMWVFGSYISGGMKSEIGATKQHGMRIRRFTSACEELRE